jgi:hypothetical protein
LFDKMLLFRFRFIVDSPLEDDAEPAQRRRRPPRPTSFADASISIATISADVPPLPSPSVLVIDRSYCAVSPTGRAEVPSVQPAPLVTGPSVSTDVAGLPGPGNGSGPLVLRLDPAVLSPTFFSGCWRRGCRLYLATGRTRCCRGYVCGFCLFPFSRLPN